MNPGELFANPFIRTVLVASVLVAMIYSLLGVLVVLRRIVFVGAALSQIAATAVGFGMHELHGATEVSLFSLVVVVLAAIGLGLFVRGHRVPSESVVGVFFVTASALGYLLLAQHGDVEKHMTEMLFGDVISATPQQNWVLFAVLLAVVVALGLFGKELIFVAFDRDTAAASGVGSLRWDVLFFALLGIAIAAGLHTAGSLTVFGFLVLPAVTGLLLGRRMTSVLLISVGAGVVSAFVGVALTFRAGSNLPTGPTMLAACAVLLTLAWLRTLMQRTA
jgi:ABC-type Mn2+/Zn2+ transport system permease subunit